MAFPPFCRSGISIHALREEGDVRKVRAKSIDNIFLSTPSARRATTSPRARSSSPAYFYPRPPRGGRLYCRDFRTLKLADFYPRPPRGGRRVDSGRPEEKGRFLSTPSARRATVDGKSPTVTATFLSTPSARRATALCRESFSCIRYFYPRPPRGGRPDADGHQVTVVEFLSTPSARRATAKTETKSLFSYKLYNILHEFRRALIYNGSKNYPNHAKRLENPVRRCRKDAENSPFAPGRETQNNSRPSCSKGG